MGTIIKNTTSAFVDGQQITSDALNNLIDDAILNTTAVSAGTGLTVNASTGVLSMDTSLTGKTLTGGSLNNCPIGASTPSTGAFTTLSASSGYTGSVTGNVTGNLTGNVTGGTGSFTTLTASDDANFDSGTLFVDASANSVGIGTTTPSHNLDVNGLIRSDGLIFGGTSSYLYEGASDNVNLRIGSDGPYVEFVDIGSGAIEFGNAGGALALTAAGTARVNITSAGNVGIGSTLPDGKLVVAGAGSQIIIDDTDATDTPRLRFRESGITSGSIFTDASDLIFDTGTTERVRITSAGKVGIGTGASPLDTLHVVGTGRITSAVITPLLKSGDGADNITIQGGNSGGANIELYGESHASFANKAYYDAETHAFRTANGLSTKLFIDSSTGNVGIGDDTPSYKLDVNGDFRATGALRDSAGDTGTSGQILSSTGTGTNWINASSGGSSPWTTSGSNIYYNTGNVGINDSTPSYKLDVNGTARVTGDSTFDGNIYHNISGTATYWPGYHKDTFGFQVEDASTNGSTVHVGRKNVNALTLGTSVTNSLVSGKIVTFYDTDQDSGVGNPVIGQQVGYIAITSSTVSLNSTSDYRLKENVVDISDGILRLKELKPYRFNFIRNPNTIVDGFFAHEVSPFVPEAVCGEKDEVDDDGNPVYQGIDQSKLVPLLTAALQEAVAKIEALEARVAVLEG